MPYSYSREQELSNDVWNPHLPLTMLICLTPHTHNTTHAECVNHRTQQQRDTSPFVHIVQEQCTGSALSVPLSKRAVPPEGFLQQHG
jgi:hypothetical protein